MMHESLNTTQIYLAVTDKRLREAVNLLDSNGKQPARKTRDDAPAWAKELDKIANDGKNYIIKRDGGLEELS